MAKKRKRKAKKKAAKKAKPMGVFERAQQRMDSLQAKIKEVRGEKRDAIRNVWTKVRAEGRKARKKAQVLRQSDKAEIRALKQANRKMKSLLKRAGTIAARLAVID